MPPSGKRPFRFFLSGKNSGAMNMAIDEAVMIGMKEYYVGHIRNADPQKLDRIFVGSECTGCRIRDFCGGRCLYSNITKPWSMTERETVCGTVENHHSALTEAVPRIRALIETGTITLEDFAHEKFNGCEIIP
jgi:radical SAM protein with 4Fe4S-binding SPASM domain